MIRISATYLVDTYHGRNHDGQLEWPPSPYRLLAALLRGATDRKDTSLRAIERHAPPVITAPTITVSQPSHHWMAVNGGGPRKRKTIVSGYVGGCTVSYYYAGLPNEHLPRLREITSQLSYLGTAQDLAVLSCDECDAIDVDRWLPGAGILGATLRCPIRGSLWDLNRYHREWIRRVRCEDNQPAYYPPRPVRNYRMVYYHYNATA